MRPKLKFNRVEKYRTSTSGSIGLLAMAKQPPPGASGQLRLKSRFGKPSASVETGKCLTLRRRRTLHPAEQLRLLATPRLDQPVGGVLDAGGNAGVEFLAGEARRQGIEEFDHQRARIAHEGAARPEQPRIQGDRQTGHAAIDI